MPSLFEDVFEIPGTRIALLGVALLSVPGVRRQLRPVARTVVRAGLIAGERVREWAAEAREQAEDIMAEARADLDGEHSVNGDEPRERPRPTRRTARRSSS